MKTIDKLLLLLVISVWTIGCLVYVSWLNKFKTIPEPLPIIPVKEWTNEHKQAVETYKDSYVIPTFKPTSTPTFEIPEAMPSKAMCYYLMDQRVCK